MTQRHRDNAPGDWYVDTNCINCKAAQTVAPGLIVERGGQSVFAHQPETEAELVQAWRARLLCPTASVRSEQHHEPPADAFPERLTETVYRLGYNARNSWGAHSFLIRRARGNAMVDAPRWTQHVVDAIAQAGGLALVLLTHRDDVADAERYAKHFGARVFIHEADRAAAPYATDIIEGCEASSLAEDLRAIPVPGHTKGSVVFLHDNHLLFTGDSLAWDFEKNDLRATKDVCWYSWPEQTQSLRRLLDYRFDWVFPGHGGSYLVPVDEMHTRLAALVTRMATQ
jgi:glyoxylase-like metal-dependent hydrolase (beta-lactamase superfamily II)